MTQIGSPRYLENAIKSLSAGHRCMLVEMVFVAGAGVTAFPSRDGVAFTISIPRIGTYTNMANPGLHHTIEYAYARWKRKMEILEIQANKEEVYRGSNS